MASARVAMHCGAGAAGRAGGGALRGHGGGRSARTVSVSGFYSLLPTLEFSSEQRAEARSVLVPEWEVARCLSEDQSQVEKRDGGAGLRGTMPGTW